MLLKEIHDELPIDVTMAQRLLAKGEAVHHAFITCRTDDTFAVTYRSSIIDQITVHDGELIVGGAAGIDAVEIKDAHKVARLKKHKGTWYFILNMWFDDVRYLDWVEKHGEPEGF